MIQWDSLDFTSSSFLRRRSVRNSDTERYPRSGCSLMNFSASSNRGLGILGEPYLFDIYVANGMRKFNDYASYMSQCLNKSELLLHICNKEVAR